MVKTELIEVISEKTKQSQEVVTKIVEAYMKEVKLQLSKGNCVVSKGFGTFKIVRRKAKIVRNIRTEVSIELPERNVLKFVPSKDFKVKQ